MSSEKAGHSSYQKYQNMVFNINWNKQQKYRFDVLQPTKHVICLTHNSAAQSIQSVDRK